MTTGVLSMTCSCGQFIAALSPDGTATCAYPSGGEITVHCGGAHMHSWIDDAFMSLLLAAAILAVVVCGMWLVLERRQ